MAVKEAISRLEAAQERLKKYVGLKEYVVKCVADQLGDGNKVGWLLVAHEECDAIVQACERELDHARNAVDKALDS